MPEVTPVSISGSQFLPTLVGTREQSTREGHHRGVRDQIFSGHSWGGVWSLEKMVRSFPKAVEFSRFSGSREFIKKKTPKTGFLFGLYPS